MNAYLNYYVVCISAALVVASQASTNRLIGVPHSKMTLYTEGKQFTCFDGSNTIPFDWVNDDYCDCRDASDEPGTSACDNGVFTCTNKGYKPVGIRSNRVNDGICDCCDGSDEWRGYAQCNDSCWEFARAAREEADKRRKLLSEGYHAYLEYVRDSQRIRAEKQTRLGELEAQIRQVSDEKAEKEKAKSRAEDTEREAKTREETAWKETKEVRDKQRVLDAFRELDANSDGRLEKAEMRAHMEFDIDANGEVSDDEAQEHLDGNEGVDEPVFVEKVWAHIKDIYKPVTDAGTPSEQLAQQIDDERDERDQAGSGSSDEHPEDQGDAVVFSDETKRLIEIADAARREFEDVEKRVRDSENEAQQARDFLKMDFGTAGEFAVLHGKCFEFTDREYTYKFCPFDRTVQRGGSSYSETPLGNWNSWGGSAGTGMYSSQKYTGGQSCWNGPERSTNVEFECGSENQLTHASEPSRCEYRFVFRTPAACNRPPAPEDEEVVPHEHGEL